MLTEGTIKSRLNKGVRVLYDDDIIDDKPLKDYETEIVEEWAGGDCWYRCIMCRYSDRTRPEITCPACGRLIR